MNSEIKAILSDLEVNNVTIPTQHIRYIGNSKTFVTWAIIGEKPVLSAYDEDLYSVVSVDIDIFSDGNYLSIVKEIKRRFKNSNWLWVEDSSEMYEEDTKLYHMTVTFEKEKEINNG